VIRRRALLAGVAAGLVLAGPWRAPGAEPLLVLTGAALEDPEVEELLPLPGEGVLRMTDVVAEYRRTARRPGETLAYDLATGRFTPELPPHLGGVEVDRLPGDWDWHRLDAARGVFVPLGRGPALPLPRDPGAPVLLATASRAEPDRDGDGIADAHDVCIEVPDGPAAPPAQRDTDGDGYGNRCDPDFDGNGVVNFGDLARMRVGFLSDEPDLDLDGDGVVDFGDLAILRRFFLQPPGPSGVAP